MPAIVWSDWQLIPAMPRLSDGVLAEMLDGGQAFRWRRTDDGQWTGVWAENCARLRLNGDGRLEYAAHCGREACVRAALVHYLSADADYAALTDALPWRSDAHLARCLAAFPGLRVLRQPFGETLLCFLCSATKQIAQIRQMVTLLAERHGHEIAPGVNRLPTWPELAGISESGLRRCRLGFRAGYIAATARFLIARPGWLEETESLSYSAAKARLMELPGVGEKIADCVLLFGAGRCEAFPVDTWIIKALAAHYGLARWNPARIAHFGRTHFGPLAGLAQQFLFAYERLAAREPAAARPISPIGRVQSRNPRARR